LTFASRCDSMSALRDRGYVRVGELEALFESETVAIALFDAQERCVRANRHMQELGAALATPFVGQTMEALTGTRAPGEASALRTVLGTGVAAHRRVFDGTRRVLLDYLPIRDDDARVTGVAIVAVDTTEMRRIEQMLEQRLNIAELISEVSASFIDLPSSQIDSGIAGALRLVGEVLDLDRTHIGLFSPDHRRISIRHQWVRPGVAANIDDFQDFQVSFMPWSAAQVLTGGSVVVARMDELPPAAEPERVLYAGLGTKSVVVVPLAVGKSIIGMTAFSTSRQERAWTADVLASMRLIVEIIASAFDRKHSDEALQERLRFEELLSDLSTRVIHASVENADAVIEDALAEVARSQRFDRTAVFLLDATRDFFALKHEWCAPEIPSFKSSMLGLPISKFGWPVTEILKGQTAVLERDKLPEHAESARRVMDRDGLKVLAIVPLSVGGTVVGCIGFHRRAARPMPEAIVARLRLVGDMVSGLLARKRAEEERQRAFDELSALKASIERERDYLREEIRGDHPAGSMIGSSPALRRALEVADAVASTNASVLIRGESGVGKELFARAIHERSPRREAALVKVNCASVPKDLFESEFFGHVRGAFTGALKDRAGRFELADGGTLFLDEVGEIPLDLQPKLLRVLQESEFERIGDDRTRRVDVRVIAATNRNLEADVAQGRFRQDLYYRLSVFPIEVPPLRARREDILPLAEHFLRLYATGARRGELSFTEAQRAALYAYDWPGNVRELQHVIERAVILSRVPPLRLELALEVGPSAATAERRPGANRPPASTLLRESELRDLERENLVAALERSRWRIGGEGGAAELLGVRPSTLRDRMKALGIHRP
jgi:transcriptional regulator with GAF, ATPase, and Fis domain